MAVITSAGLTAKAKLTWLKLEKFSVEVCRPSNPKYAIAAPAAPPMSPALVFTAIGYALLLGLAGGLLPAIAAVRQPIVAGLRAT